MKNILLPLDFEEGQKELLNKACDFAKQMGAKLHILHVLPPEVAYPGMDMGMVYIHDVMEEALQADKERVQTLVDNIKNKGVEADGYAIVGSTVPAILDEVESKGMDLIIMGHHDRGFFYSALFGSTSAKVVRNAKVPILVYPVD